MKKENIINKWTWIILILKKNMKEPNTVLTKYINK